MVPAVTYHARRWRTLFEPQALNFTSSAPRQVATPVYTAAPTGIHCGLPKAARTIRNPRAAVLLLPMVAATGIVVFMEKRLDQSRGSLEQDLKPRAPSPSPSPEEARRIAMLDAYGDRSSLQALDEVMKIYEATK